MLDASAMARATASADVNNFITSCFTDAQGTPIVQAPVHEELQKFLEDNPKALVELPPFGSLWPELTYKVVRLDNT